MLQRVTDRRAGQVDVPDRLQLKGNFFEFRRRVLMAVVPARRP